MCFMAKIIVSPLRAKGAWRDERESKKKIALSFFLFFYLRLHKYILFIALITAKNLIWCGGETTVIKFQDYLRFFIFYLDAFYGL